MVLEIDIQSAFAGPSEGNAKIPRHTNGPALRIALQCVESESRNVHFFRANRDIEQLENPNAFTDLVWPDPT